MTEKTQADTDATHIPNISHISRISTTVNTSPTGPVNAPVEAASMPDIGSLFDQWNTLKASQAVDADALRKLAEEPSMAAMIVAAQKTVFAYVDNVASVLAKHLPTELPVGDTPPAQTLPATAAMQSLARLSCEREQKSRERKAYAKNVVIAGIINFGNKNWRIDDPFTGWTAEQNPSLPLALLMLGPLKAPAAASVPAALP